MYYLSWLLSWFFHYLFFLQDFELFTFWSALPQPPPSPENISTLHATIWRQSFIDHKKNLLGGFKLKLVGNLINRLTDLIIENWRWMDDCAMNDEKAELQSNCVECLRHLKQQERPNTKNRITMFITSMTTMIIICTMLLMASMKMMMIPKQTDDPTPPPITFSGSIVHAFSLPCSQPSWEERTCSRRLCWETKWWWGGG